jgi:hypothetical protein
MYRIKKAGMIYLKRPKAARLRIEESEAVLRREMEMSR